MSGGKTPLGVGTRRVRATAAPGSQAARSPPPLRGSGGPAGQSSGPQLGRPREDALRRRRRFPEESRAARPGVWGTRAPPGLPPGPGRSAAQNVAWAGGPAPSPPLPIAAAAAGRGRGAAGSTRAPRTEAEGPAATRSGTWRVCSPAPSRRGAGQVEREGRGDAGPPPRRPEPGSGREERKRSVPGPGTRRRRRSGSAPGAGARRRGSVPPHFAPSPRRPGWRRPPRRAPAAPPAHPAARAPHLASRGDRGGAADSSRARALLTLALPWAAARAARSGSDFAKNNKSPRRRQRARPPGRPASDTASGISVSARHAAPPTAHPTRRAPPPRPLSPAHRAPPPRARTMAPPSRPRPSGPQSPAHLPRQRPARRLQGPGPPTEPSGTRRARPSGARYSRRGSWPAVAPPAPGGSSARGAGVLSREPPFPPFPPRSASLGPEVGAAGSCLDPISLVPGGPPPSLGSESGATLLSRDPGQGCGRRDQGKVPGFTTGGAGPGLTRSSACTQAAHGGEGARRPLLTDTPIWLLIPFLTITG